MLGRELGAPEVGIAAGTYNDFVAVVVLDGTVGVAHFVSGTEACLAAVDEVDVVETHELALIFHKCRFAIVGRNVDYKRIDLGGLGKSVDLRMFLEELERHE